MVIGKKKKHSPKRKERWMWKDVKYLQCFLFTMRHNLWVQEAVPEETNLNSLCTLKVSSRCSPAFTVGVSQFSQSMIWFNLRCECFGLLFFLHWSLGYLWTHIWICKNEQTIYLRPQQLSCAFKYLFRKDQGILQQPFDFILLAFCWLTKKILRLL